MLRDSQGRELVTCISLALPLSAPRSAIPQGGLQDTLTLGWLFFGRKVTAIRDCRRHMMQERSDLIAAWALGQKYVPTLLPPSMELPELEPSV